MQRLAEICVARPVFATMMALALVILGGVSYTRLGIDRQPAVDLPTVRVRATLPGASPEDVEVELSDRIEEEVNTVAGIDQLRSISGSGSAVVIATFGLDRDIDVAAQDVRDRVSGVVRDLPSGTDPPTVAKANAEGDPVFTVALFGPRTIRELTELADKVVRPRLERSTGVGEVQINGDLERTVNVWIDPSRLDAYGLSVTAVRDAIADQNADVPGGNVRGALQERALRTLGRLDEASAFADVVVANRDGVPVRVRDVARVEDGTREMRRTATLDGVPTVVLEIIRQSGANSVEVIRDAKLALEDVKDELPPDVQMVVTRDQSRYIEAALHEINVHLVAGSILASLVVLAFMRSWRSTIIAAVAIPTSVVATFGAMWALGFTLNGVTMLALVLMVGIVIDDAIVVLENIFRFVEEKGLTPMQAAVEGTREIGLAVLATTLSLVVIFVPVSFLSSIAGRFLYEFGITSAVAVLVSLFVSFSLTPMMASRFLRAEDTKLHGGDSSGARARSRGGFYGVIERSYERMLSLSVRHRAITLVIALGVSLTSIPLLAAVPREFVPGGPDDGEFGVNVSAGEGVTPAAMRLATREMEEVVRATPGVAVVEATAGGGFLGQANQARFYIRTTPHDERLFSLGRLFRATLDGRPLDAFRGNYSQGDVMDEVERRLQGFPGVRVSVRNFPSFELGGAPYDIDYALRGPDLVQLYELAEELRTRAVEVGGFRGLDTSLRLDKPELRVDLNRERAADLGVDARDVGSLLRLMVAGEDEVSRFRDPTTNEQYDVLLRLEGEADLDMVGLGNLKLPSSRGGLVPLEAFASLSEAVAPSRIDRLDRQRVVSLRGGVAPGYALGDRLAVLRELTEEIGLPPGVTTSLSGRSREMERTFDEFAWAFGLSIVLMYLILASQFESFVHPLTILLSLPLSVPFALLSLIATDGTLNIFSALGMLVLFGVVKKNSILQIDHINGLRATGMERMEAILLANRDRLRPILMTTLSLVAGMLPLAVGTGPGAEERRAVAIVIIGGQTLCLLLTLLVTPAAYAAFDDLGRRFVRKPRAERPSLAPL
ncbi:MAG: AcrB/AcrD/AcrF family protein [Planctomycetaceae bacterium]|nr:AcrB/AcrD/AcrF family protein [Planctomycetaceae bacterium]